MSSPYPTRTLTAALKKTFPEIPVDVFHSGLVQIKENTSRLEELLGWLLERGVTAICVSKFPFKFYPTLFQFEEVWHTGAWYTELLSFINYTLTTSTRYDKVRSITINNIRWVLKNQKHFSALLRVFPRLEEVEYPEYSTEVYKEPPYVTLFQTQEYLGKVARPQPT